MADAYRAKMATATSTKAAYGVRGKSPRVAISKNQQPPGAVQTSVLPRIDRPTQSSAASHLPTKNSGNLSILLPPRRPSAKETSTENNSPTFHGDEIDGPSAKAAWCTPRGADPKLRTGSHVASFFAGPEGTGGYDEHSVVMPTTLRLQSVEERINANEEQYRVDMDHLASNNAKFFEISGSANQHLEHMSNQLPNLSEAFEQTASALQNLSSDIATLHQQHESAKREMENQLEKATSNNADEMVHLSEAHAADKTELIQTHDHERQEAGSVFRGKVAELESKYNQMEKSYMEELQELRQTSDSQMQTLHESSRAERDEQERLTRTEIERLQAKAKREFDDLRSSTESAYQELQERSQTEFADLQQTSTEALAVVRKSLTSEIMTLKQSSAVSLAALGDRSARELQELREQSDDALQKLKEFYLKERAQLLEKASEESARLRMLEIDQSARMENRRCRETKALREELDAARTNSSTHIQELHRRYTSELEVLKVTSEGQKTLLLQTHASEIENLRATAAQELSETISSYQDRLISMSEEHAAEEDRNKKEAVQAREILISKYESDLTSLENDRIRERDALVLRYETEIEALKQANREEHDRNAKLHETQLAQLREAHSSRVLALEMAMREQNKQTDDTIREKDGELESKQVRINVLEASEIYLKNHHEQYAERSLELVEQKNMALCELESEIWRLNELNVGKDAMLEDVSRAVKVATEDLQGKANTILELTFVVKSRDDEIEKLRNALLDTVQTVNTKTEILELTTETLSSKAKELEATKNALRLESGRLTVVEESMHQKEGMLENTELKMESMRLNMENMRLEMKRMQMDMKLQLEHTEGEIELKNGEIRRLHGTQSELKQKNDFSQQTIERLEESLAFAQRQGEEAQRRIDLLRLEASQAAEELKQVCDELLGKEQELVVTTREKQTISAEKQRLQIQFNNMTLLSQTLHEKVELYAMQAEEIRCQCQKLMENSTTHNDERMRSERHLHMLELSAAKEMIRHLEGVEERSSASSSKLETVTSEKHRLEAEVETLNDTLRKYKDTDQLLCTANEDVQRKNKFIEDKLQELARLHEQLHKSEEKARHELDSSRMEMEDSMSNAHKLMCSKNEAIRHKKDLESCLAGLRAEKQQLALSLGQEKMKVVSEAEDLQEKVAGLRKGGVRAASELSDLQHALNEKKKELAYLQENLGDQTSDTRKIRGALDVLTKSHTELRAQLVALSNQRESENQEHLSTIQSLQDNLESQTQACESLRQTRDIQRQEMDLLLIQHDSQVVQLTDGLRSEAVQLIESHRAQLTQLIENNANNFTKLSLANDLLVTQLKDDQLSQNVQLVLDNMTQVTQLKEEHLSENNLQTGAEVARLSAQIAQLTEEHRGEVDRLSVELTQLRAYNRCEIARISEENYSELSRLKESYRVEINRLTDDLNYQLLELTVDRLGQITEQTEDHRTEVARLTEEHRTEIVRLDEEHESEIAFLKKSHQAQVEQLRDDHSYQVSELKVDRRGHITEQTEERLGEVARLTEAHEGQVFQLTEEHLGQFSTLSEEHLNEFAKMLRDHQSEIARLQKDRVNEVAHLTEDQHSKVGQLHVLLKEAADEQVRVVCAHSLEMMTIRVAHQHEMASLEQHLVESPQQDAKLAQVLENVKKLEAEQVQTLDNVKRMKEEFTQTAELMRLRLTEEHLTKVNELLERSRVEEERHEAVLVVARGELSDKSNTLKSVEDAVVALKLEITKLQTQLQDTKQEVLEREADVAAKNATIDNVRKELNLLMETTTSIRSREQFVALIRQQLETHLMEVYHVEFNGLPGFVLEEESDLLRCLQEFFAMRCYRGVAPPGQEGGPESDKVVTSADDVRELLREHDRVISALAQLPSLAVDDAANASPSEQVTALIGELDRLKLHVGQIFISTREKLFKTEDINTDTWVKLIDGLGAFFETLAIPRELENAVVRSQQLIGMFKEREKFMLAANSSCLKDDVQQMSDIGNVFIAIDQVLTRARQVTRSDRFMRLEDLMVLFNEWEALHEELDESKTSDENRQESSLHLTTRPALAAGSNYLRSSEILASRQAAADFVQRCKEVLQFEPAEMYYPDEIVDAIKQLMKIVHQFELLQPKLGSPRRQPTAADTVPTLDSKVTAVLAFVDELRLMADFAHNILSDETKNDREPVSNESSSSNLEALGALTRNPSPASTLGELQIDVELAADDELQDFDRSACEFSNEEEQEVFFSSPTNNSSSRSPSPFLADSLMDISLVMSDHHQLLSQTARYVVKSRQGSAHNQTFSVGTEIGRLVREHCTLLSLSRRLFKMKDPRQELVSLLEGVALLERMAERLALFQMSPCRDTDEMSSPDSYCRGSNSSESATSLGKSDSESLSRSVLASIGDMARHLQDYDYFLRQVKIHAGQWRSEDKSPAAINIEALVKDINERVTLVEQSKELLGLQNPVDELPQILIGAQEVLRQAKQLRESSVCFDKSSEMAEVGPQDADLLKSEQSSSRVESVLSDMDSVVDDLRSYNGLLTWMKQVLPEPESVKSVVDLKDRVKGIMARVESLTSENANLMQGNVHVKSDLEQMKQTKDQLVEEESKEGALLLELAALQSDLSQSPIDPTSTRCELLQTLIKQQQKVCEEARRRHTEMETETSFLLQHALLSKQDNNADLSACTRIETYNRLLESIECLRSEKTATETSLAEEKNTLEASLKTTIQQLTEKLESVEGDLAQTRHEMDNALAGVESCATQEYEFLKANRLLSRNGENVQNESVPTRSALSSIRLEVFQRPVASLEHLRQNEDDLAQENIFLQENNLAFDLNGPHPSRLVVYGTLLTGQNALIEEKIEREVALESEKEFLASHGVPAFETRMEVYEQFVQARKQLDTLTSELGEELRFLTESKLLSSNDLTEDAASLATPFSLSFRQVLYRRLEQQLSRQISSDDCIIAALTARVERLEALLMVWQETAYASQREWDRMLLEEEDKRRSLTRRHEEVVKQTAEDHTRALEEVTNARNSAVAIASASNAEALKEAAKNHETRLVSELQKQAQRLELAAFVLAEKQSHEEKSLSSTSDASVPISAAQTRATLLEKFAKRDTMAINIIYKVIRLTTDILSAVPTASATTLSSSIHRSASGNTSEISSDVTQTVLACVKELKTLKEFLVQSLEQVAKDDDNVPPSFAKAPYAKWMADAVTRATADTECAIDWALCSHREFMSFAEVQLLTRQEELENSLARVLERLSTAARNGGFSVEQEKLLALELEVAREREARETVACKFRLNEEYYRRLLDERKEMEIAQSASVGELREESKALRLKLDKLEQQFQQQTVLPQFRPPSTNTYTSTPRGSGILVQASRVLKTAVVSNVSMPMRPERPRGGGSAHKERFVSDLERETGQRRSNTTARRLKASEKMITENPPGSQLEQDFRVMQAAVASHHTPAMEPVVPTAMVVPATAPGSSLQNQEIWYQGVRSIHYVSFFISIFHVPRQQLFRVEVFNSDTEQQQQTVYVAWTEMQAFLQESRKAVRLGIALPTDPEMAVTVPHDVRTEIMDVLFERIRVYGEDTDNILLGFE